MGKKLAIRGHESRGNEVIEILETMGGHATVIKKISNETDKVFFISDNENCFYRKSIRFIPDSSKEIEEFKPVEYWTIDANLTDLKKKSISTRFYGTKSKRVKPKNQKEANSILEAVKDGEFKVYEIKKGTKKRVPLPPFITSTLQQDASRKLGIRPERAMKIAQELYEGINIPGYGSTGLITYMRTDSLRISNDANDIHVINLEQTVELIDSAYAYIKEQATQGKTFLFVGTIEVI